MMMMMTIVIVIAAAEVIKKAAEKFSSFVDFPISILEDGEDKAVILICLM